MHRSSTSQNGPNCSKQMCGWILTLLWTHIWDRSDSFKSKLLNGGCFLQKHSFSIPKTLVDGLKWCELLMDHCDVFISRLDSHSDGTHSLQRIHW